MQKLEVRDGEKIITLKDGSEIAAGAVIVASGASFRKQGCPGESTYTAWAFPTAPYATRRSSRSWK